MSTIPTINAMITMIQTGSTDEPPASPDDNAGSIVTVAFSSTVGEGVITTDPSNTVVATEGASVGLPVITLIVGASVVGVAVGDSVLGVGADVVGGCVSFKHSNDDCGDESLRSESAECCTIDSVAVMVEPAGVGNVISTAEVNVAPLLTEPEKTTKDDVVGLRTTTETESCSIGIATSATTMYSPVTCCSAFHSITSPACTASPGYSCVPA